MLQNPIGLIRGIRFYTQFWLEKLNEFPFFSHRLIIILLNNFSRHQLIKNELPFMIAFSNQKRIFKDTGQIINVVKSMAEFTDQISNTIPTTVDNEKSKQKVNPLFNLEDNRPGTIALKKIQNEISNHNRLNNACPVQEKDNHTGLPSHLKFGVENLSGQSMNDVKVHYNSDKPSQLQAHAIAQGTDIYLAAGQEKYLPHESWHVVQQKQGRVRATFQLMEKGKANDDKGLEKEADVMGARAIQLKSFNQLPALQVHAVPTGGIIQKAGNWSLESLRDGMGHVAGIVGSIGGAIGGAVTTGAEKGYRAYSRGRYSDIFKETMNGALKGGTEGIESGYERPGAGLGALAGGIATAAFGLPSALPILGATLVGGLIGSKLNKKIPRKTTIQHTTGYITLNGFKGHGVSYHEVGKKMKARLAPIDPVRGSATDVNWTWMQFLRDSFPKANIVRGHLLNHDLGGFGMPANLYPISTKANQDHSTKVEQKVKHLLAIERAKDPEDEESRMINYTVDVAELNPHNPMQAAFNCSFSPEGEPPVNQHIPSLLGTDRGGFAGGVKDNPLAATPWHHGDRKGFEKPEEKTDLLGYMRNKNIKIVEGTQPAGYGGISENENAVYEAGGGMRKESIGLYFDQLEKDKFFSWGQQTNQIQRVISTELGNSRGYFKDMIVNFVCQTDTYTSKDYFERFPNNEININKTIYNIKELIVEVVRDQLNQLLIAYPNNPDIIQAIQKISSIPILI